ncbi:MAG TPA: TetR family transcriptional regulator [Rhodospirillales bacterium]|mgnify:CR=1 FL=1|nr:TetR family transcriptional regulator [Rhodospirillales bacterium]
MVKKADVAGRIIAGALELAAEGLWRRASLSDIAGRAGVTLAQLQETFPGKTAIIEAFLDRIDHEVLGGTGIDTSSEPRDRLFDVLMRRFDALAPYKTVLPSLLSGAACNPCAALVLGPRFLKSMAWMLEAAGISSAGLKGLARVKGLAFVYMNTARVWLKDDSEDASKTMAALDKGLKRAERLAGLCNRLGPGQAPEESPA